MRLLIALTYYRPHVSGVTIYAERLARGLARRGHAVTVLTSRFAPALPARERVNGVDIVRVPVWMKISKGVIMPAFPVYAAALVARNDVVNVHMPQFEAALFASLGRLLHRRVVVTYHCDLQLPPGWFSHLVQVSLLPLNRIAAALAHEIVINTDDYGRHSRFLSRFTGKLRAILPPIEASEPDPAVTARLVQAWKLDGQIRIGFAARFAAEKGVEYLLRALPRVLEVHPRARIVFSGAYKDTVGEDAYRQRLAPMIERLRERLTFLDLLPAEEMPSFFALCDVLAVTSLNSTESFGLVQAEAMMAGTPVVATDLPGVREAVRRTGMGLIVPPRDPEALAKALIEVIGRREGYVKPRSQVAACFDLARTLGEYEALFDSSSRSETGSNRPVV
jgi:glycosyltransferase involved in cell wall biosynthesis